MCRMRSLQFDLKRFHLFSTWIRFVEVLIKEQDGVFSVYEFKMNPTKRIDFSKTFKIYMR